MSHISQLVPSSVQSHPLQKGISFRHGPDLLFYNGFSLKIEVSTAGAVIKKQVGHSARTLTTRGLLDTGATRTAIDMRLAKKLNLIPIGYNKIHTAAGIKKSLSYTIGVYFIGSKLKLILNLKVSSCDLGFTNDEHSK